MAFFGAKHPAERGRPGAEGSPGIGFRGKVSQLSIPLVGGPEDVLLRLHVILEEIRGLLFLGEKLLGDSLQGEEEVHLLRCSRFGHQGDEEVHRRGAVGMDGDNRRLLSFPDMTPYEIACDRHAVGPGGGSGGE